MKSRTIGIIMLAPLAVAVACFIGWVIHREISEGNYIIPATLAGVPLAMLYLEKALKLLDSKED